MAKSQTKRKSIQPEEPTPVLKKRQAPGKTPQARENQLISGALDLAAKQIRAGTASSQVITHFLKLGSSLAELEKQKLKHETDLIQAKSKAISEAKDIAKLYKGALKAMRDYSGQGSKELPEDEIPDETDP